MEITVPEANIVLESPGKGAGLIQSSQAPIDRYGKSARMQEGNMLRRLGVLDVVLVIAVVMLCVVVAIK
jgi:hypothetical protein